jgi:hypothetical protein
MRELFKKRKGHKAQGATLASSGLQEENAV